MKRIMIAVFAVVFAGSLMVACGAKEGGQVKGESFKSEGWVDANTFRVISTGVPKAGLVNKIQRRGTAKEAAIIMAEKRIIEKFVGARLEGASGAADYASTGVAVAKEFSGDVKGGTLVKETYDDDDNCEIVYQVEKKGLKKEVMGGATAIPK
jgi:hypothetical protein